MIKLSIITICYNDLEGFNATKASVLPQLTDAIDWIVIDGGSTDGSKEAIEAAADRTSYWVSEPDKGIYNAMNKGIAKAKGEYILFLNSGDCINPDIKLQECLGGLNGSDFEVFDIMISHKGQVVRTKRLSAINETQIIYFLLDNTFPHQSTLIKSELFKTYGEYDETLKISSDWAFYVKAFTCGAPTYHYNPISLSIYDDGGISTVINQRQVALERDQILKTYLSQPVIDALVYGEGLFRIKRHLYKHKFNAIALKWLMKITSLLDRNDSKD